MSEKAVCLQETAFEASQKYKEGKFIIEKARVIKVREPGHTRACWPCAGITGRVATPVILSPRQSVNWDSYWDSYRFGTAAEQHSTGAE